MSQIKSMKWPIYGVVSPDGTKYLGTDEEWHAMKNEGYTAPNALEFWEGEEEMANKYAKLHNGIVSRNSNP